MTYSQVQTIKRLNDSKARYWKSRERILAYKKAWRLANLERVNAYSKASNQKHKHKTLQRRRQAKIIAVGRFGNKCAHCSNTFSPAAFDFHHIDPHTKTNELGNLFKGSLEKMMAELNKCIMLCANCHRTLHWNEKLKTESAEDEKNS